MKTRIIYLIALLAIITLPQCTEDLGEFEVKGEAIELFSLLSPENNETVILNVAAPDKELIFKWNETFSGLDADIAYSIAITGPDGDIDAPLFTQQSDEEGVENMASVKFSELITLVNGLTVPAGETPVLKWNIKASNASGNTIYGNADFKVKVALTDEGITPFSVLSPEAGSIFGPDGSTPDVDTAFTWETTTSSITANTVKYKFLVDELDGDFSEPLLELDSDNAGETAMLTMTHKQWYETFRDNAVPDGVSYSWAVMAYTDGTSELSETGTFYYAPVGWSFVLHIVGDATEIGWDIGNAIPLTYVAPNMNVGYVALKSGGFKFFPEKGSWDNGLGDSGTPGELGSGGDLQSPNTTEDFKLYRITIDYNKSENKYYYKVIPAEMVMVGNNLPSPDWTITNGFNMFYEGNGKWATLVDMEAGEFKFFAESGNWNSGYGPGDEAGELSTQQGGPNIAVATAGYYKVSMNTFDLTYSLEAVDRTMYVVGTPNGWDINNPIVMTWNATSEVWEASVSMSGEKKFKFFPQKSWSFGFGWKYGEPTAEGGGTDIVVEGADGTYDLTLDIKNKTYSIVLQ